MGQISAVDAERIRRRYPQPRIPRPVWVVGVTLVAAIGLVWLLWAATVNALPPVKGEVTAYRVVSDTRIDATVTVTRPDPARAATCRVKAQAEDYQVVAEQTVEIPATAASSVNVSVRLTTLRRATTAVVDDCSAI